MGCQLSVVLEVHIRQILLTLEERERGTRNHWRNYILHIDALRWRHHTDEPLAVIHGTPSAEIDCYCYASYMYMCLSSFKGSNSKRKFWPTGCLSTTSSTVENDKNSTALVHANNNNSGNSIQSLPARSMVTRFCPSKEEPVSRHHYAKVA